MVGKNELKRALLGQLEQTLAALKAAHADAVAGATHAEAKPENDKDTRALEQSYLARGQAQRVEQLTSGLLLVHAMSTASWPDDAPIAVGALVELEDDEDETRQSYWLCPAGGGSRLSKEAVSVITPNSPVGEALIGKRAGDDVEVMLRGRKRTASIRSVR